MNSFLLLDECLGLGSLAFEWVVLIVASVIHSDSVCEVDRLQAQSAEMLEPCEAVLHETIVVSKELTLHFPDGIDRQGQ